MRPRSTVRRAVDAFCDNRDPAQDWQPRGCRFPPRYLGSSAEVDSEVTVNHAGGLEMGGRSGKDGLGIFANYLDWQPYIS